MIMSKFYPTRYYDKKEDIPVERYYEKGFRGISLVATGV